MTPNAITMSRLLCAPFVALVLALGYFQTGLALYCIAAASDFVDGRLARATNTTSAFGRAMDSAADKALVLAGLVGLLPSGALGAEFAAGGLVFLFAAREIVCISLRTITTAGGAPLAAIDDNLGRLRFSFVHAGIIGLIAGSAFGTHAAAAVSRGALWTGIAAGIVTLVVLLVRDRRDLLDSLTKGKTGSEDPAKGRALEKDVDRIEADQANIQTCQSVRGTVARSETSTRP